MMPDTQMFLKTVTGKSTLRYRLIDWLIDGQQTSRSYSYYQPALMTLKNREEIDILDRQNAKFYNSSFTGQNTGINPFFESWIRRPTDEWLTR